jgi:hypothetical protein
VPTVQLKLSSHSVEQYVHDSQGSQGKGKGSQSTQSLQYQRATETGDSPMMVQGTNPFIRKRLESQMNI